MSARTARLLLVAMVVLALVGIWVARRTDPADVAAGAAGSAAVETTGAGGSLDLPVLAGSAPAVAADTWLNSPPLDPAALAGKVVLYDFWTFGCVNCQHTLPAVKAWWARYAADGLVVLSIHSPEFSYEADPDHVADFVADHGITYPVALDPDHDVWRAFANRYWPAFYLHDRNGRRRYVHFGEGAYQQTEDAIRALLGVAPDAPRAEVPA